MTAFSFDASVRLDGNTTAGFLREVFAANMTTAYGRCAEGGLRPAVGALHLDGRSRADERTRGAWRCAVVLACGVLASCLEYSPNALPTDESEHDLNAKAIARLHAQTPPDADAPVRFAVVGDVHVSYEELERAVERLNDAAGLELVVQLGDFTHLGTLQEFRLARERFDRLRVPYVVLVGNHDLLGNGGAIYERMFGPRDLAFVHRGVRLVFLDTNSREHGFAAGVPRLTWLAGALGQGDGALRPAPRSTIVFAHVPPSSSDFHPDLGPSYLALLGAGGVASAFYGHEHRFDAGHHEAVTFWMADALDRRTLLVVTVRDGVVSVEREAF